MATFSTPWDAVAGYVIRGQRRTLVTLSEAAKEQRRLVWPSTQWEWDLYFRKDAVDLATVLNFWDAGAGRYATFDWVDPNSVARKVRMKEDLIEAKVIGGYGALGLTFVLDFTTDATPPTVSNVTPANGATNQAIDVNVVWVMAEAILPSDVTATYFHLIDSTTGTSVACALSLSGDGLTVTLNPTGNLTNNRLYLPRIEAGVHDLSNNQLVAAYGSKFTTIA